MSIDAKFIKGVDPIAQPDHLKGYVDAPMNQIVPTIARRGVQDVLASCSRN